MKVKLTELNTGYKGEKKVSRLSEKGRAKIVIAITLVVVFIVTFILSSVGVIPLDALLLKAKVSVTGSNERFPLAVNTESSLVTDVIGDNIVILTTESVVIYSQNGKQLLNHPHVFAKPAISINGKKAIVYDRGGKSFVLINDAEVVYEGSADSIIFSAEYGKDGNYALGIKGEGATSSLLVFNKSNNLIFQWNCAQEHIVSISLSNDGKYAGAAVLGVENGDVFTTVHYFGFDYKEPLNTQKIPGVSALDLKFTKFDLLTLLTNEGVYVINDKNEKFTTVTTYYSSEFNSCDFSDNGRYVVALAKYGSENNFQVDVYNKDGELKTTVSTDFAVKTVRMSDKYIFILGDAKIMVYNLSGVNVSTILYKGEAHSILPTDDFVYITSLDKITRCFSYGDANIELNQEV